MPGIAGFLPSTVWQILGSQKLAPKFHPATWKTVILLGTHIFWGPHFDVQPWGRCTRQSKSLGRSTPTHSPNFCESWGAKNAAFALNILRDPHILSYEVHHTSSWIERVAYLLDFFFNVFFVDVSIIAPLFYANMAPTTFRYFWKKQEDNRNPENEHHVRNHHFSIGNTFIFKWWIFHCRVSFRGGIYEHTNILGYIRN